MKDILTMLGPTQYPGEPQGAILYGNGNSPATTLNNVAPANGNPSASAFPLGLTNDYTGVRAQPASDVLKLISAVNSGFSQYDWRLRSGDAGGRCAARGASRTAVGVASLRSRAWRTRWCRRRRSRRVRCRQRGRG